MSDMHACIFACTYVRVSTYPSIKTSGCAPVYLVAMRRALKRVLLSLASSSALHCIWYYTVLHYTTLHYTILYYTILAFELLHLPISPRPPSSRVPCPRPRCGRLRFPGAWMRCLSTMMNVLLIYNVARMWNAWLLSYMWHCSRIRVALPTGDEYECFTLISCTLHVLVVVKVVIAHIRLLHASALVETAAAECRPRCIA